MHLQALYYISDRMRNEIVLRKCICPPARFSMTGTAGYGIIQITIACMYGHRCHKEKEVMNMEIGILLAALILFVVIVAVVVVAATISSVSGVIAEEEDDE